MNLAQNRVCLVKFVSLYAKKPIVRVNAALSDRIWSILVESTEDSMRTLHMKSGVISVMLGQPYRRCSRKVANAREHRLKSPKLAKFGFRCAEWCNNSTDQAWFKIESVSSAV